MANDKEVQSEIERIWRLVSEDRAAGIAVLRIMAENGDEEAIESLALFLSEDPSTEPEAIKWLSLACEMGSADAAWNLACIARQRGDLVGLKSSIDRAAELGEPDAILVRSNGYKFDAFFRSVRN